MQHLGKPTVCWLIALKGQVIKLGFQPEITSANITRAMPWAKIIPIVLYFAAWQ